MSARQRSVGWGEVALVGAGLAAAALWLLLRTAAWPDTPDGLFHLQRTRALAEALGQGVLYPRWFPNFAFGYGHPILHYYAPAFYYPPALFHGAGMDLLLAVRLALAGGYALSGLAVYLALRSVVHAPAAWAASLLYLAFPYRLYDLFVRGALPEFAAFLWPPLLLYAALHVLRLPDGRAAWRSLPALGLALSWAGLVLTHNLTALMALAFSILAVPVVAALPLLPHLGRSFGLRLRRVGLRLGLPALWGGLLSAFYSLPALLEARWVGIGATPSAHGYAAHLASWAELVQGSPRYLYPAASFATVPLPVYALPLLGLGGLALLWPGRNRAGLLLAWTAGALAVWLTTAASAPLWAWTAPLLGKLQFPWRWQTLLALALAVVLALLVDRFAAILEARRTSIGQLGDRHSEAPAEESLRAAGPGQRVVGPDQRDSSSQTLRSAQGRLPRNDRVGSVVMWAGATGLGLFAFVYAAALPAGAAPPTITPAAMWAFDADHGQVGATWTGEFLPVWVTEPRSAIGRAPEVPAPQQPPVELDAAPLRTGYLDTVYHVRAAAPLTLTFDRFYFPAWQVRVDGVPVPAAPVGPLALLGAPLPAGEHQVAVLWRATPAVWAGRAASLIGWALIPPALHARSRRMRLLMLAGWLALGAVTCAGMAGWTARAATPAALDADFGPVRLEAAVLSTARPGQVAPVRLFWTVTGAAPDLVAFVHVLGPDGAVAAQWDEPLGTVYRPPGRWMPGLLMTQTLPVPLPAALPPGGYHVLAGLYPAGRPDAPLVAAGKDTPRLPIGWLQVQP